MNIGRRWVAIVAIGTALACVTATAQVRPQFDLADVHASAVNRAAAARTMQGNVVRDGVYRIQNATMVDLHALMAAKPRLQKADPATRTKCIEGPGADGKDPRASNALLSRLVTCRNITMQQFAEELPRLSRGSISGEVLDATGVTGAYDLTLSFSGPAPSPAALAAGGQLDPGGAVTLFAALERQLGLKLEKRTVPVRVNGLDHIEEKPTDN